MARGCIRCCASKKLRVISFIKPAKCFTSKWNLTMTISFRADGVSIFGLLDIERPGRNQQFDDGMCDHDGRHDLVGAQPATGPRHALARPTAASGVSPELR